MLLPFVLGGSAATAGGAHHHVVAMDAMSLVPAISGPAISGQWWIPVGLHTLGYLLTTAFLALLIYHKLGLAVLRRAWFNFDYLWVAALVVAGILTLVI